jgi:hypothetical protein
MCNAFVYMSLQLWNFWIFFQNKVSKSGKKWKSRVDLRYQPRIIFK